jgi:branched-chain amino acid transport system ATP-binding protein
MALLEIKDLTSGYGDVQILWGSTMALEKGKLTCLVGGNGVGKTTLLRTLMGLIQPWNGTDVRWTGCEPPQPMPRRRWDSFSCLRGANCSLT